MILIYFLKYYINLFLRHLYWIYRLSTSDIGKKAKLEFPIIREGKGKLIVGNNSFICKKVRLGVGEKATLRLGNKTHIETKGIILVNKNCSLTIADGFKLGQNARLYVQSDWCFGKDVKIETNCAIFAREPNKYGKLTIGDGSHIGDYTIIDLVDDVTIGNEVAIGPNCTIYSHEHVYDNPSVPAWKGGLVSQPIFIGDGAWVGSNVTILPGITIGKRTVVAAGSVVTKNLEPESIYGGIPAKLIKRI
ncbi:MAG: DapH/DapD/GlmU-related protein [Aquaticitalea sp.]